MSEQSFQTLKLYKKIYNPNETPKVYSINKTSICIVKINNTIAIPGSLETNYLKNINQKPFKIFIGKALNLIDWMIEKVLLTMADSEYCECIILIDGINLSFKLLLVEVVHQTQFIHDMSISDIFTHAVSYKENGVKCFKAYPSVSHEMFSRAAKLLLTYLLTDGLDTTLNANTVEKPEIKLLYETLCSNLAACLLKKDRYNDVIDILNFVGDQDHPTEKNTYRLTLAYLNTKQLEKAKYILDKVNVKESKSLSDLSLQLQSSLKCESKTYASIIRKMFK